MELDGFRCAYCMTSMRIVGPLLEVDHVVPRARGGATEEANLCLACPMCNGHKADRGAAVDPVSGLSVRLYHPRQDSWAEHFAWTEDGTIVRGTTPIGRATVAVLQVNHEDIVAARRLWVAVGWHPPTP
jgi:hypothetical protein